MRVLFDTGSDKTLINKRALPKQAISAKDPLPSNITGVHGTKPWHCFVKLNGMQFPEFAPTTKVAKPVKAIVFDNEESSYDVILEMDILQPLGFKIDCATLTISWNENTIPFRPANYFNDSQLYESVMAMLADHDDLDQSGYCTKTILSSKYKEVDMDEVARQQSHLSERQQQELAAVLRKHTHLFSGKLGQYPNRLVHLDLIPNSQKLSPLSCSPA